MDSVVNALFAVLWIAVGFFVLRFIAVRIFHEQRRAEIASGAIVIAFAMGTLWPYSTRFGTSTQPTAIQTTVAHASVPDPTATTQQQNAVIDVTKECRSARGPFAEKLDVGSIDVIRTIPAKPTAQSMTIADDVPHLTSLFVEGWAADRSVKRPARAVCLLVDGRMLLTGTDRVGVRRPDVASGYHRPELATSGYQISIPSSALRPGVHHLRIIAEDHRVFGVLPVERTITVK